MRHVGFCSRTAIKQCKLLSRTLSWTWSWKRLHNWWVDAAAQNSPFWRADKCKVQQLTQAVLQAGTVHHASFDPLQRSDHGRAGFANLANILQLACADDDWSPMGSAQDLLHTLTSMPHAPQPASHALTSLVHDMYWLTAAMLLLAMNCRMQSLPQSTNICNLVCASIVSHAKSMWAMTQSSTTTRHRGKLISAMTQARCTHSHLHNSICNSINSMLVWLKLGKSFWQFMQIHYTVGNGRIALL